MGPFPDPSLLGNIARNLERDQRMDTGVHRNYFLFSSETEKRNDDGCNDSIPQG